MTTCFDVHVVAQLEQLIQDAERRYQDAEKRRAFLQSMLDDLQTLKAPTSTTADAAVTDLSGSYSSILLSWARTHSGQVVMREVVDALAQSERWRGRTRTQITRALTAVMSQTRERNGFMHVEPGVYRLESPR